MKTFRLLLVLSFPAFCVLSCAKAPRASGPVVGSVRCQVDLVVDKHSLPPHVLARALAGRARHSVSLGETAHLGDEEALLVGARHGADIVVNVQPGPTEDTSFVTAVAKEVSSGKLLGEAAIPAGKPPALIEALASWYDEVAQGFPACPLFDPVVLAKRLKEEDRCDSLLDLYPSVDATGTSSAAALSPIISDCRKSGPSSAGPAAASLGGMFRTNFEGVPDHLQRVFADSINASGLDTYLQGIVRRFTSLVITCKNACSEGQIRLVLPFDPAWHQANAEGLQKPLDAYLTMGKHLLEYRRAAATAAGSTSRTIRTFPIELVLEDTPGVSLKIVVEGSIEAPMLKPASPPEDFFGRVID